MMPAFKKTTFLLADTLVALTYWGFAAMPGARCYAVMHHYGYAFLRLLLEESSMGR